MAAAQSDRRASHAQASTKDTDTAMTDATHDAGESSSDPHWRPAVFFSGLPSCVSVHMQSFPSFAAFLVEE